MNMGLPVSPYSGIVTQLKEINMHLSVLALSKVTEHINSSQNLKEDVGNKMREAAKRYIQKTS